MALDDGDEAEIVAFEDGFPVIGRGDVDLAMRQDDAGHFDADGIGGDSAARQVGHELDRVG
ncbi:hypothetical protein D3C77_765830 [compost metagenome]